MSGLHTTAQVLHHHPPPPSSFTFLDIPLESQRHYHNHSHDTFTAVMTKDDNTTVLDKPIPVGQATDDNIRPSNSSSTDTPPTTPPPAKAAKMIGDLKIVYESPGEAPKHRKQQHDLPMSREELLEQAAKFLESSPIKDAPLKEKLEFLHTKGLTKDETEALLARLEEKVTGTPTPEEKGKGKQVCHERSLLDETYVLTHNTGCRRRVQLFIISGGPGIQGKRSSLSKACPCSTSTHRNIS